MLQTDASLLIDVTTDEKSANIPVVVCDNDLERTRFYIILAARAPATLTLAPRPQRPSSSGHMPTPRGGG